MGAWAPILAAGIQGGAGLLGGLFGSSGQQSINAQQIQMAEQMQQQQEQFQERMSDTAYQRGMADMKAAGLNPILAANLGGASTPPGSSVMPTLGNPGAFMQQGITSAGQMGQVAASTKVALTQAEKDASQVALNKSTTAYTDENAKLTTGLATKAAQDTATSAAAAEANRASANASNASAARDAAMLGVIAHQTNSAKSEADLKRLEADAAAKYGPGAWGHIATNIERMVGTGSKMLPPAGHSAQGVPGNITQPPADKPNWQIGPFKW